MTNMATMPINGKKLFKSLLLWNQKAIGFGTWYVGLGMWALNQVSTNDESRLTLTYLMARSNLIPYAFI